MANIYVLSVDGKTLTVTPQVPPMSFTTDQANIQRLLKSAQAQLILDNARVADLQDQMAQFPTPPPGP